MLLGHETGSNHFFSQHETDFKKPPLFALNWEGPRGL